MGKMGFGYGSEWHLLRYLGRHRDGLDRSVREATKSDGVSWLDFRPSGSNQFFDGEWEGIDFLLAGDGVGQLDCSYLREGWEDFWPQSGTQQNWDAVGILRSGSQSEWLLVEAKAHPAELSGSGCGATAPKSLTLIRQAFKSVGDAIGVADTTSWTGEYYQHANRLATLWFLLSHGVAARLLYVYFLGETHWQDRADTEDDWKPIIAAQDAVLGLDKASGSQMLKERVHNVFLPVQGPPAG